jgi:hypothetical protein
MAIQTDCSATACNKHGVGCCRRSLWQLDRWKWHGQTTNQPTSQPASQPTNHQSRLHNTCWAAVALVQSLCAWYSTLDIRQRERVARLESMMLSVDARSVVYVRP